MKIDPVAGNKKEKRTMLYHLFEWFKNEGINFPGRELFRFITFRILIAVLLSLFITTVYGKKLIRLLQKKQIGESVRDLGLQGEQQKKGTPTMGGLIIIAGYFNSHCITC